MEELTCPNCNIDVDREELKRSNLRCPTCGYDMSDAKEEDPLDDDLNETDEEEFKDEDEEEDEE